MPGAVDVAKVGHGAEGLQRLAQAHLVAEEDPALGDDVLHAELLVAPQRRGQAGEVDGGGLDGVGDVGGQASALVGPRRGDADLGPIEHGCVVGAAGDVVRPQRRAGQRPVRDDRLQGLLQLRGDRRAVRRVEHHDHVVGGGLHRRLALLAGEGPCHPSRGIGQHPLVGFEPGPGLGGVGDGAAGAAPQVVEPVQRGEQGLAVGVGGARVGQDPHLAGDGLGQPAGRGQGLRRRLGADAGDLRVEGVLVVAEEGADVGDPGRLDGPQAQVPGRHVLDRRQRQRGEPLGTEPAGPGGRGGRDGGPGVVERGGRLAGQRQERLDPLEGDPPIGRPARRGRGRGHRHAENLSPSRAVPRCPACCAPRTTTASAS